ncbi:MAG: amidophosphoribosyltransferase [Coriobacteriales bacterium]
MSTERYDRFERDDKPEEECGVFGVYAPGEDVSHLTYFALHALQHRGQESAGIAVGDGNSVTVYKDLGLVTQIFKESDLEALAGKVAVGHTRYSTSGGKTAWDSAQPHLSAIGETIIALAHNGTLVNWNRLRAELLNLNLSFRSNSDSEVVAKLIGYFTQKSSHMREGIRRTMQLIEGAYAVVLINDEALYAFRDPNGIRPLSLGELPDGRGWVVASETCAFDIVGARFVRDIAPGEVIRVNDEGVVSEQAVPPRDRAQCIFEYVYFARPDSVFDGVSMYDARVEMGRRLARQAPADADLVIGVPDSGVPAAIGFSQESGIPYDTGIVKNRYVGRTFIQPTQELRKLGIRLKLNPLSTVISGKRVVVVDDSIVRGNTSRQIVEMLREAGATEVHMRVVSPEVRYPCFYGIDTDTQDQLIAANMPTEQIREHLGADSLAYITLDQLIASVSADHDGYCAACFDARYPVPIPEGLAKGNFLPDSGPRPWVGGHPDS